MAKAFSVFALVLCALCSSALAQSNTDGWNFTPLNGVTNKTSAWYQALQAAPPDNSTEDPRLPEWWSTYKAKFYKTYATSDDEAAAYDNWKANLNVIIDVNGQLSIPYWLTGNQYADYNQTTFRDTFLMRDLNLTRYVRGRLLRDSEAVPVHELVARRRLQGSSVDWRAVNRMTPVKDQGGCGSCWAYAATAAIESVYLITLGLTPQQALIDLSEQQLIDCCTGANGFYSSGCSGGSSDSAIAYTYQVFQTTEKLYPATYSDGSCKYANSATPPANAAVKLGASTQYITTGSESSLMAALAVSPLVIYFEVVGDFFGYAGGVYQPTTCGTNINHAMVAVGYVYTGDRATSYWIVRNSWSANWGVNGHVQIQMTGTNAGPCGMYQFEFQPPKKFALTLNPVSAPPPRRSPPPSPRRRPPPPKRRPPPPRRRKPTPPRPPPRPPRTG